MKKVFTFGKVDYRGNGRKDCPVTVTVELKQENGRDVFSVSGEIWNARKTDIYCGGQCLDTIAEYVKAPIFKEIYRFWKLYHLNDMHPECEHQAAAGWRDLARENVSFYVFKMTHETLRKQNELEKQILDRARNGYTMSTTEQEQLLLKLKYIINSADEELPPDIAPFYKLEKIEHQLAGWLHESEHPRGILCKPCPVCGYKYGTSWKYFPIPEEDKKRIIELISK